MPKRQTGKGKSQSTRGTSRAGAAKARGQTTRHKKARVRSGADWAGRFLEALAQTCNITVASAHAGVTRKAFYNRRDTDPAFRADVKQAMAEAVDALELEARRRAMEGTDRPVFYKGKRCGFVREYSDTLLIFLLKAHRPKKFRERYDVNVKGRLRHSHSIDDMTDEELLRIAAGAVAATAAEGTPSLQS